MLGPKDREGKSCMTGNQVVGRLPDDWWTLDTRGTNPVIVEEYPMETRSGISASSGLDFLSQSSRAITVKQRTVTLQEFPAYLFICLFMYLFIPLE